MKKVSVRSFCLLLTLVLLTTFLPAYAEEAHEPLSLYCSASWNMSPFLSAFHEAYPEVQLNVINLATSNMSNFFTESLLQGECIPDIYTTTILPDREAQQRYLLDLSGEDFTNNYTDAALREVDNSGKVYLLPSAANLLGIYYNKTLIERLGLALPNSFEDLLAMKEALPDEAIDEAMVRFYKDQYGIDLDPEEKIELLRARMDLDGYIWNFFFNLGATDFFSTPDGVQWKEDFLAGRATAVGTLEPVADLLQKYIDAGFIDAKDIGNNRSNPTFMLGGCLFHMALQWTAYHWESPDYGTWNFGFLPYLADENGDNVVITQTARYYGLNKDLANNPQKLEDAKKFLAFLSTPEGQAAWAGNSSLYYSPVIGCELSDDSPFYEVSDLLEEGYVVASTYNGWEPLIYPFAAKVYEALRGEATLYDALAILDEANKERLENRGLYFAEATETLYAEDTARLNAIAFSNAVNADAALISVASIEHCAVPNSAAVCVPLFAGGVGAEAVSTVTASATQTLETISLTGAELNALVQSGFDKAEDGTEIFPYRLFIREDAPVDERAVYTVVVPRNGLPSSNKDRLTDTGVTASAAVTDYLTALGTVSADALRW